MSKRTVFDWLFLPFELWYSIWTFPDDYYAEKQRNDLISTVCYIALKVIWVLVSILWVWLWVCPFFGF